MWFVHESHIEERFLGFSDVSAEKKVPKSLTSHVLRILKEYKIEK